MVNEKNKRKLSFTLIMTVGFVTLVLFAILILISNSYIKKTMQEVSSEDIRIITDSYAKDVGSWVSTSIDALDFYTKSEVVWENGSTQEIASWLATTESRRSSEFDYVLFIDTNGNSFYDSGKTGFHGDREYFSIILKGQNSFYVTDPTLAKATGKWSILIVKPAFNKDHKLLGMFVGTKQIDYIQAELSNFKLGDEGYAVLLSSDGTIISHPNPDVALTTNFLTDQGADYPLLLEVCTKMVNHESGMSYIESLTDPTEQEFTVFAPVPYTRWSVAISVPTSQLDKPAVSLTKILITSTIFIELSVILCLFFIVYFSLKPLSFVVKSITDISKGNADLTHHLEVKTKNEIGDVANSFNDFVVKLNTIVSEIKNSKEQLVSVNTQLQKSTDETDASIKTIVSNMGNVKQEVSSQNTSVSETTSAISQISDNIQALDNLVSDQSSAVVQASAAVEELIGNINAINSSMSKMGAEFKNLLEKSTTGYTKQELMKEQIDEIVNESKMLQEANSVISTIAEQTNLLAMNAAIEAAHAGDAGKGFSVVADEIRKLSETSSAQSRTIGEQLNNITKSIERVVSSSQDSTVAFSALSNGIGDTDQLVQQVLAAMEEQQEGSKQILSALQVMQDTTVDVRTAAKSMLNDSNVIQDEIKKLEDSTAGINSTINTMNMELDAIDRNGGNLTKISFQMSDSINKIGNEIDQFKV